MQHIVAEFCPHCETEIEMSWDFVFSATRPIVPFAANG